MRFLASLFAIALLLTFPALAHPIQHGGGGTNAVPFMAAATRLAIPQGEVTTDSAHQYGISRIYFCTPAYTIYNPKVHFSNWYATNDGTSPTERTPGNSVTITGATIEYPAGTFNFLSFAGQQSITLADGADVWSAPLAGFSMPANSCGWIRSELFVATGGNLVLTYRPSTFLSEGMEYSATSQAALLNSGTITCCGFSTFSSITGPDGFVAQGWNGTTPVVLLVGDSICNGANDQFDNLRGNLGYVRHGIDDSVSSTQMPYISLCGSGTSFNDATQSNFQHRINMMTELPNLPFTSILSEMGVNSNGATTAQYTTLSQAWWTSLKSWFSNTPIVQTTLTMRTSSGNNTAYSTVGDQSPYDANFAYPSGSVLQFNSNLTGGIITGGYVSSVINVGPYAITSNDLWPVPGFSSTLAAGFTGNTVSTVSLNDSPPLWTSLVFGAGTSSVDSAGYFVSAVTGSGPYSVTLAGGAKPLITQTTGSAISSNCTYDGLHPNNNCANTISIAIITAKNAAAFAP
jgi:hypothetical protein